MSRKKLLLPILAGLPLLFMANSTAPFYALDDHYQAKINITQTTSTEAPFEYQAAFTNDGEEYATIFQRNNIDIHIRKRGYIETNDFDKPLFINELILPGETKTYTFRVDREIDNVNFGNIEECDIWSLGNGYFSKTFDNCTVSKVEGETNQYMINGIDDSFYNEYSTYLAVEAIYDGQGYAFYVKNGKTNSYFETSQDIDLSKLSITRVSGYISERSKGGTSLLLVMLFLISLFWIVVAGLGIFIIAPAIVIPAAIKKARGKGQTNEVKKKPEEPIEDKEIYPEDFNDINRIE